VAIGDVEPSGSARTAEVGGTNKYSHDLKWDCKSNKITQRVMRDFLILYN
jgi:hypothetical protein